MAGMTRPARKAKPRLKDHVAKRVASFVDVLPAAQGVMPLNAGFFKLERMRADANRTKARAKKAKEVKG